MHDDETRKDQAGERPASDTEHRPSEPATRPFDARLDLVPTEPGVYLMKDEAGQVIYVGKARNLRQRLRAYFTEHPTGSDKVLAMIRRIADFTYLVCATELEALVLESNLIKRYQPFYNILLKDDHDYPYIRVTLQEEYPRVLKAYRVGDDIKDGARYYGPFLTGDLNRALRTIHEIFALKTCRRVFPRDIGKERPCLNYYIHRCIGPCLGTISAEAYRLEVQKVCDYLEGRYDGIIVDLEQRMNEASQALQFEKAAVYRDRIRSLKALEEHQRAVLDIRFDGDVLGLAGNAAEVAVLKLEVRNGKITGTSTFFLDAASAEPADILEAFMQQYYPTLGPRTPARILVPVTLEDPETLEQFLTDLRRDEIPGQASTADGETGLSSGTGSRRRARVRIEVPKRGERKRVLDMAMENARRSLRRRTLLAGSSRTARDAALQYLARLLELPGQPFRIEAYDISNTGRDDMSCGMVVFENGRVDRSKGRLFTIRSVEGIDDYGAMREAIERRLGRLDDAKFGLKPDIILLDGGRGHVSTIRQLLDEKGIEDIALAGMVKDDRHRTRGLVLDDGRILELADRPAKPGEDGVTREVAPAFTLDDQNSGLDVGLHFEEDDEPTDSREHRQALLRLLASIQNEAHRLANKHRKQLARKRTFKYTLEEIPGVGPKRRQILLKAFPSLKAIRHASYEEIRERAPKLGPKTALAVWRHYHPDAPDPTRESPADEEQAAHDSDEVDGHDNVQVAHDSGETSGADDKQAAHDSDEASADDTQTAHDTDTHDDLGKEAQA